MYVRSSFFLLKLSIFVAWSLVFKKSFPFLTYPSMGSLSLMTFSAFFLIWKKSFTVWRAIVPIILFPR